QRAAASLTPAEDAYLHLSGISLCRVPNGEFAVKQHYFSNASGISYMIQNRRALARVIPQSFQDFSIRSIADAPVDILELLRSLSDHPDPTVVLLSSGPGSAVYSEHSFLARRMGIPLVQGGDLLVLNDAVFLKTVSGLEKVEVIYNRISDQWLDPMVFRRDSLLGVAGLVHCIRKGTVAVVNAIGSQLSDDRALLPFAGQIIGFYLGERALLPTLPTYWLGDIDQREMVLAELEKYTIRPLFGEKILLGGNGRRPTEDEITAAKETVLRNSGQYVAQPQNCDALTVSYHDGRRVARRQDHILFALRKSEGQYDTFPGALTRVSTNESPFTANELGGGSKDTWVQAPSDFEEPAPDRTRLREALLPSQHVSSRVAEAFYWTGRYLERAHNLAVMIGVIESLELEELNLIERTLYRPVWDRILPPLENPGSVSRRNISSPAGRYRLTLDLEEPDSVVRAIQRAAANSESILECLSLEAWSVLSTLRSRFQRARFRPQASQEELTAFTRRYCDWVVKAVPEFFGTAQGTMIADGGWAFCEIGQLLERAIITANAVCSIMRPMPRRNAPPEHEAEIRLSAFLRLINSRDVYRRVYQLRIEPAPMLDLLWKNPVAPRSVARCLETCRERLRGTREQTTGATMRTLAGIEQLLHEIRLTDWEELLKEAESASSSKSNVLLDHGYALLDATLEIHHLIADAFLNHQIHMGPDIQPTLFGFKHAL
ncbi:MAG: circularly permuted type 2 ATP-grasp protein, partial [Terrimicrobium sp.]